MASARRSTMVGLAAATALLVGAGAPALAHGGDDDDDDDRIEQEDRIDREDRDDRDDRDHRDDREDRSASRDDDDRSRDDRSRDGVNRDRVRADGRREIRRAGQCTGSSRVKLKVKNEDRSRLEVEFEVDQNRAGDRWATVITRNGRSVLRRAYVTRPPSGSFEARRILRDTAGRDVVVGIARNTSTGERCRARVVFP
jgi:hypothetical protein